MKIVNGKLVSIAKKDIVNGTVTIPESVTEIGDWVFAVRDTLTSIIIPSSVTNIGNFAFKDCTGLSSITIPNTVNFIGSSAFYGCTGLTSVAIPDSVKSIGYSTFYGCTGLTSVTIPDSVESIGSFAFEGCTGLTSVTIPDSVKSIGSFAFKACTNLKKQGLFKATNANMQCRDFQFELGKWYEESKASLCNKGFHFCENAFDLFNYCNGEIGKYVRFFEVEVEEASAEQANDSKRVCKKIKLVREITSCKELLN